MAKTNNSLALNTNSNDNIPDEKKGNSSLTFKKVTPGAPASNAANKRARGDNRSLKFSNKK